MKTILSFIQLSIFSMFLFSAITFAANTTATSKEAQALCIKQCEKCCPTKGKFCKDKDGKINRTYCINWCSTSSYLEVASCGKID